MGNGRSVSDSNSNTKLTNSISPFRFDYGFSRARTAYERWSVVVGKGGQGAMGDWTQKDKKPVSLCLKSACRLVGCLLNVCNKTWWKKIGS